MDGRGRYARRRGLLLGLARVWPGFPGRLAGGLAWLEAHGRPWPERAYTVLPGYWYWLGALDAMRANRRAGRGGHKRQGGPETGRQRTISHMKGLPEITAQQQAAARRLALSSCRRLRPNRARCARPARR